MRLPSGVAIRVVPPANLLATKLEAFAGRGNVDYFGSADFEDIVVLVDGREELVDEVTGGSHDLRVYLAAQLSEHVTQARARDAIVAHLEAGRDGRGRFEEVVLPRLRSLIASPGS